MGAERTPGHADKKKELRESKRKNKKRKWRQCKDQSKRGTKMERHSPILTTQESLRYRAETELESCYAASGMTRTSGLLQDCDHRSTTVQGKMVSVLNTYPGTRVGADITSSLGMKATIELCHQKCRLTQACSRNQGVIYHGSGGGALTN